ncbi:FMN-binding negative transcriptional regulator [Flavobacteriaceae bacterium TP-CH-4]|uniref:FMN-binding negative transcriptional regulator n=1 Tax=Pelagihabitans pacificus TaxID=2696054 RepID=A0A967E572_9FLAO|nr:FMN-binding negative transcriptional regulator [Pelagihabitans pacificus]NHF58260.1 FMN-binding negative transcriptional regulator [Pelagihabitans pacificus]
MKYPPRHHQEASFDNVIEVVKNYPFGTLISVKHNKPFITHIPLVYEPKEGDYGKLVAHIDASNPQVTTLVDGADVTTVFYGPDCYISPSVYSTRQLPTWNYIFAHLKGKVRLLRDKESVKKTMVRMTRFLEGENPKYTLDYDDSRMERLVDYIVGFEIKIDHWEGKFKFSQDKLKKDRELAKEELIRSQKKDVSAFVKRIFENHENAQKTSS